MVKHKLYNGEKKSCSSCATNIFEKKEYLWAKKKKLIIGVAGFLLTIGLLFEFLINQHFLAQSIFLIVVILLGYDIVKKSILSILQKRLDMNFLMSIAAIGAFLIGHGEEGAAVIFLFFIAEFLEDSAAERARKSITSLLKLAPEIVLVKQRGKNKKIHVHETKIGNIIIVKPGDRIALDGVVIKGVSSVNESQITGESIPIAKKEGSAVFAGTINEEGYLEIKVTKKSDESILHKIVDFVEKAKKKKSQTEAFIDKFSKYYTPAIIVLSFLVAIIPTLLFGLPFEKWLYRALVLLVVSCPCALAISTPIAMVSAITSGARNGVLIKGGGFIEEIRKVKVIVFDKTGTLTMGKPEVIDVIPLSKYTETELLQIAASLEEKSKHPLARAIINNAEKKHIKTGSISEFSSITGKGLKGKFNGEWFYIGNKLFFSENKMDIPKSVINKHEKEGKTVVLVGNSTVIIGAIALMDKVRESSLNMVKELKNIGIRTVMLTGDNEEIAKAVAKNLEIDEYHSELLPEDKVRVIDNLLKRHEHVIMIGDGVNDAPALVRAHVGIAMGAIGSDVAIETADISLMHDDLSKIKYLINLSKKTMSIVKQNIFVSILVKSLFIFLAFPGAITLWVAVAIGDLGLSLAVILNALRIGRIGRK